MVKINGQNQTDPVLEPLITIETPQLVKSFSSLSQLPSNATKRPGTAKTILPAAHAHARHAQTQTKTQTHRRVTPALTACLVLRKSLFGYRFEHFRILADHAAP